MDEGEKETPPETLWKGIMKYSEFLKKAQQAEIANPILEFAKECFAQDITSTKAFEFFQRKKGAQLSDSFKLKVWAYLRDLENEHRHGIKYERIIG